MSPTRGRYLELSQVCQYVTMNKLHRENEECVSPTHFLRSVAASEGSVSTVVQNIKRKRALQKPSINFITVDESNVHRAISDRADCKIA